jgi:predicted transcriptional regulator
METLLISLHPRHAQNILSGKKIIELRKKGVREDRYGTTFDHILIYETLPTAAIIGVCEAGEILYKDAQTFSNNYQSSLCLNSREIWDYLGDRMGYGIRIKNPKKITPIPLSKMREVGILPPQGYRYLADADLEKLGVKFND